MKSNRNAVFKEIFGNSVIQIHLSDKNIVSLTINPVILSVTHSTTKYHFTVSAKHFCPSVTASR